MKIINANVGKDGWIFVTLSSKSRKTDLDNIRDL